MPRWDFLIRIANIGYVNRGQTEARMRRSRVLRLRHLALRAGTAWSEASVLRRWGLVVRRFALRVAVATSDRQRSLRGVICPTRELQRWGWRRRSGLLTARLVCATTRKSTCIHRHCAARMLLFPYMLPVRAKGFVYGRRNEKGEDETRQTQIAT